MRKVLMFLLLFTGTAFMVFIFNLLLYAFWPAYHDAVSASVTDSMTETADRSIPVVTPQMVKEESPVPEVVPEETVVQSFADEQVALSPEATDDTASEPELVIVDKQYHEDCGTGKGYWVITYSDGSTEIE
ncbi:hypothetical protein [Butyrivibrio sp. AE2032]|uniref:hypothetical protein n=1 Tax=Butyrivibrio sp. AE2032 TaxID=1458463 RepID=UPI0005524CFE|nr:hypothetical protein [Butyrivibrio sp. AE2032]